MIAIEQKLQILDKAEEGVRTAMRCVHAVGTDPRATERMLEQFRDDLRGLEALRSSVRESVR